MAIKRPRGARPDATPRRALGIKCGFKLPSTYPTGVPYIVTRYLSESGSSAYKEDQEKGAIVQPCRIIGSQENGSTFDFHVEIEPHERHQRRRNDAHDPDTDPEVMAFAPWTFKLGRRDKKVIEGFQQLRAPVTVIRLPEVEIARPLPDAPPYGVNPRYISIRLAMNEQSIEERKAFEREHGYLPDFNCFAEAFQVWDNSLNRPYCRGNAEFAERWNKETGQLDKGIRCMPWIKDPETGAPNPHVCPLRGRWNGTSFEKPKNPCAEAIKFAFRVAGVPSFWHYQVFTKSPVTAGNIRPMLDAALEFRPAGDVMGFPMVLSVMWKTFTPTVNGREFKTEKPIWKLDVDGKVITSLSRQSVNNLLDGTGSGQRALSAPQAVVPVDPSPDDGDAGEFYPGEEHAAATGDPAGSEGGWTEFMFGHEPALILFRKLGYTRGKGREVLEKYEAKYPGRERDLLTAGFMKALRTSITRREKKEAEEAEMEAARQAEEEPPAEPELLDRDGELITPEDQAGVDELPDENEFL